MQEDLLAFHWRMRDYSLRGQAMDFVEFSRNFWFGSLDIEQFRAINRHVNLMRGQQREVNKPRPQGNNWSDCSMSTAAFSFAVLVCVFGAALFGMLLRMLPEQHLGSETKDTVKLAMGFVATMAALVLGLLVASAKDAYDKESAGATEMAAKIVYLDRLLANFGPETKDARELYRHAVEQVAERMWPETKAGDSELDPSASHSEQLLAAIQSLEPKNDLQKTIQAQALSTSLELGQMRWLEYVQAGRAASKPMLYILVFWTAVLFVSFGMFAPNNGTVIAALLLAAVSVAGAIFLILELRTPFTGFLQIPNTAFVDAIGHLGK